MVIVKTKIWIEKSFRLWHCEGNTRATVPISIYQKWVGRICIIYINEVMISRIVERPNERWTQWTSYRICYHKWNFYASYKSDFKVYMKNKPENYGLLFWILADVQYPCASRIIPYVIPPFNNPEKREILMNSSWRFRRMY